MFGVGAPELVLILIIALVIFGPSKLPQIGSSLGKGIRDFKSAMREIDEPPAKAPAPSQPVGTLATSAPNQVTAVAAQPAATTEAPAAIAHEPASETSQQTPV